VASDDDRRDENTRDNFTAAVTQAAGLSADATDPVERRKQLMAYRDKVEKARAEQEARLSKLQDAQRKIDAELEAFERQEAARKQVEEIKARVSDTKKHPIVKTAAAKPEPSPARRSPRFDIHAAVRFGTPPDDIIMRARNISMTGALLATEPGVVERYPVGTEHDVTVFVSAEPKKGITLRASIVRHEPSSVAVDWSNDVEASFRVALLISSLEPE
jgi:hypothetical protein